MSTARDAHADDEATAPTDKRDDGESKRARRGAQPPRTVERAVTEPPERR